MVCLGLNTDLSLSKIRNNSCKLVKLKKTKNDYQLYNFLKSFKYIYVNKCYLH